MSIRKFGTGEVLLDQEDMQKTASTEDREQVLAEVVEEQQQADKEKE